jgi:hypothetical protein
MKNNECWELTARNSERQEQGILGRKSKGSWEGE